MATREVRRRQLAGVLALLALAAIVALSWVLQRPPTPVPASVIRLDDVQRGSARTSDLAAHRPEPEQRLRFRDAGAIAMSRPSHVRDLPFLRGANMLGLAMAAERLGLRDMRSSAR